MPEIVTIYERVETRDAMGGTIVTYEALPDTTIGRVGGVKDAQRVQFAGQLRGKSTAILTVPVGEPLKEQCRVGVIGGTYNVIASLSNSSYVTASRFLVEEV